MQGFPISARTPVISDADPPRETDVVVIGGGIIGVCTAIFLRRAGHRVVLLEKGRIAGEQSGRNWGWIRQQGRDPDELPIMVAARRLWLELAGQTDADIGLREGGVTYLAHTRQQMAGFEAWLPFARAHGVDSRLMNRTETAAMLPGMSRSYSGALHTASDMRAEPWLAVPAFARLAVREGAVVAENCAVRALDVAAGRVAGVITERGRVAAPQVVLAGGAWSSLLLRHHGVCIPQLSVRATVAATTPLPEIVPGGVADNHIAFRHRSDGGYTVAAGGFHELFVGWDAIRALPKFLKQLRAHPLDTRFLPAAPAGYPDAWRTPRTWDTDQPGPFEQLRVLSPTPNRKKLVRLRRDFAALFPDLPAFEFSHAWAGMIDTMPDVVPVVDQVAALPGLTIGTGMSGHGFGIGPGIGQILASLAANEAPAHNLNRFRLSRFSDGSPMDPGPAL